MVDSMLQRRFVLTLLLGMSLFGSSVLVGCGQKGPLYLPSEELPNKTAPKQANEQVKGQPEGGDSEQSKPTENEKDDSTE